MKYREEKVWVNFYNCGIYMPNTFHTSEEKARKYSGAAKHNTAVPCILKIPVEEKKVEVTRSQVEKAVQTTFMSHTPSYKGLFVESLCKELGLDD